MPFLILTILISLNSWAGNLSESECTEIRIDTSNMPKNNNQADLEWCFAFSTSDLLSFKEKIKLSAYDIAINYHINRHYDSRISNVASRPGRPVEAMDLAITKTEGLCLEDEVDFTNGDWIKLGHIFQAIVTPTKNMSDIICDKGINETKLNVSCSDSLNNLDTLVPEKRAEAFLNLQCRNRYKVKNKYKAQFMGTNDLVTSEMILAKADEVLSKGDPLTMVYSSEMLLEGVNYKGTPNHASTIIGRKFNPTNGQCEYLIKNTWGSDSCETKSTKTIKCDQGNYWVPRTTLNNNTNYISWLSEVNTSTASINK
jgi:hypothetical protein